jgi:hypothetical protein
MFKTLCVLPIVAVLFGIYVLAKPQSLTDSALTDRDEKKQSERLAKLDPPCSSVNGTVLDVTGQIVAVQEADSPCTISLIYVNGGSSHRGFTWQKRYYVRRIQKRSFRCR